ncbi:MAG: hypothetical protein MK212_05855 [Saprospiraceae bacterium]|nr:hypothetical protein [Saprospiraceae bacterium]
MKLLLLLVFGLASFGQLWAQTDFVVTNEGDTIWGKIANAVPAVNAGKVVFKDAEENKKTVYKPFQIRSWGVGEVVYESKTLPVGLENIGVFMVRKTAADAHVHCYDYWNADGSFGFSQYFLEKRVGKKKEMEEVRFPKFHKQLSKYFEDHEELSRRITNKEFKKTVSGLMEILEEYNTWKKNQW